MELGRLINDFVALPLIYFHYCKIKRKIKCSRYSPVYDCLFHYMKNPHDEGHFGIQGIALSFVLVDMLGLEELFLHVLSFVG